MSKLYVVGTPIGNLEDFSPRGIRILNEVDFIAAEDTRVTIKLLNRFNIQKPQISYFEHNKQEKGQMILDKIHAGQTCALVTDAGMPAISDPGEELVKMAQEQNIRIEVVPGPVAFASALAVSGMPSGRFTFEGFLSTNKRNRKAHLLSLKEEERTMIFYEAPHKLMSTLKDMCETFLEDREICLCRELTKIHEEALHFTLKEAVNYYENLSPKGEFVIILRGKNKVFLEKTHTLEEAVEIAKTLMDSGLSASFAAKEAAQKTKILKNEIYKQLN